MTQPEALRLADSLRDGVPYDEAEIENELRRLHAQRDELLEALKTCVCAMQDYQAGIGITEMFDKGERMVWAALAQEPVAWAGCGECDCSFPCHDGKAKCIRLPLQQAEPVQEPVAWEGWWLHHGQHNYRAKPLTSERVKELMKLAFEVGREAAPPQRKPLTEDQIGEALSGVLGIPHEIKVEIARDIERAHDIH